MSYDPRTIAFLAEIVYQPIELKTDVVQNIHNSLFGQHEISYQNFQVAQDGIHLVNLPTSPGSVSSVTFTPDRMVMREELRATTVEDFATRLVNVSTLAFRTLGVPMSLAQQFIVRSLVTPRSVNDSREFILNRVIGADEALAGIGRPIQRAGLAFTFPQTEAHEEVFNVRLETWSQDPRSVWVENIGSFTRPVPTERLPDTSNLLFSTYRFATGPMLDFLASFDTP